MMRSSDLDLQTIGLGLVASTASLILAGGDEDNRFAFPHTRGMLHQPAGKFSPKYNETEEQKFSGVCGNSTRAQTSYWPCDRVS